MRAPIHWGWLLLGACTAFGCASTKNLAVREKLPTSLLSSDRPGLPDRADRIPTVLRDEEARRGLADNAVRPAGDIQPASSYQGGGRAGIDERLQYASLTEPTAEETAGIPPLPESIPPQYQMPTRSLPSERIDQEALHSGAKTGRGSSHDGQAREQMRLLAERVRDRMPERLDEFLKEARQGAASGNWEAVLASWEVQLDLAPAPTTHRASSLSDALQRDLPQENRGSLDVPPARVTSVSSPATTEPVMLQTSISTSGREKSLSYRTEDERGERSPSRTSATSSVDFVSFAQEMESRSDRPGQDSAEWKVYSRLLYAMAGDRDRALEPIQGMSPPDRRFWRSYVYALDRYFDPSQQDRPAARASQTAVALRESLDALAERADLEISEPIFCRAVHSFGNYEEFDRYEFRPGDGVVVYWETKQFTSVETADGYRTRMKAEIEITDSLGNRRHRFEQKFKDDVCRRKRSDYFNVVVFEWPKDLAPGEYTFRVTVTDLNSDKIADRKQTLRIVR